MRSSKWANSAEADRVLNMWNWIAQKTLCDSAGRPNKSASEVWKSTVQVNSVNLVGWVLHSRGDVALWNLVCYPLLSLSLSLPNQLLPTPPPRSASSSSRAFIPSLSSSSLPPLLLTRLGVSLQPCRFLSPARVLGAWNETGSVSARGGCRRRWNVPSFLLRSPPCSHLLLPPVIRNLRSVPAMVNPPTWTRIHGIPCREQRRRRSLSMWLNSIRSAGADWRVPPRGLVCHGLHYMECARVSSSH